jgi:uncharacterized protein (DUF433 family)
MTTELIQDRGRGPEIVGTRITVYNLLPAFLDSSMTEQEIGRIYSLTAAQVAAARAFVLQNADTVLAEHLRIEDRLGVGNPPEVKEQAARAKAAFRAFKQRLAERNASELPNDATGDESGQLPSFREWLSQQETR